MPRREVSASYAIRENLAWPKRGPLCCGIDPALLPFLNDLESPGRTLAFCDETNLTEAATAKLVANLRLHTAFVLDSSAYASASRPLADFLVAGALPEFHAAEIGLQLADMAAYVVRRYLLRKDNICQGNADPFDEITAAIVASFEGCFDHLLESDAHVGGRIALHDV